MTRIFYEDSRKKSMPVPLNPCVIIDTIKVRQAAMKLARARIA